MDEPIPGAATRRTNGEETEAERLDRNYTDLLQELRVSMPGVQILFAFLLTLPFAARFGDVDQFDRAAYTASLLTAACAAGLMIAPVAFHRALFRRGRKQELVGSAHRLASAGLLFLLVSMACAILLVTDVVLGRGPAIGITVVAAGFLVTLWGILPFLRRRSADGSIDT